jgi:hypothetical protein
MKCLKVSSEVIEYLQNKIEVVEVKKDTINKLLGTNIIGYIFEDNENNSSILEELNQRITSRLNIY